MAESSDPEARKLEEEVENLRTQQGASEESEDGAAAIGQPEPLREAFFEEALKRLEETRSESEVDEEKVDLAFYEAQIAWLRFKWGTDGRAPLCPYCAAQEWTIGPEVELDPWTSPKFFPVSCVNCGHTTFLRTDISRLLRETEEG